MGYAVVLTTASKANTTGGTFADSLTANTGDSLAVPNFTNGGARITHAWGIDSDSVAEGELLYTRYESVHDQQHGLRFELPSLTPGGAGLVAAHSVSKPPFQVDLFSGDTATISVTTTAADDVVFSYLSEYDDLPGTQASFADWATVQALKTTVIGLNQLPVASATAGGYGASRALNADDTRLSANKYYALLGLSVQTQVTTVSLISTTWGGQRIGLPVGALDLDTGYWFVRQSIERQKPLIPIINGNDAGNVLVQVADGEASTSPHVDWNMYELSRNPIGG
ncbi:MAG: hypothetical protein ACRDUT_00090 [Mycobacterium sp.]